MIVNLASKDLDATVITPAFKDFSNGKYRFLSFYAKQARGMMAAFIIRNRIESVAKLKQFDVAGYRYSEQDSTETKPVFLRRKAA